MPRKVKVLIRRSKNVYQKFYLDLQLLFAQFYGVCFRFHWLLLFLNIHKKERTMKILEILVTGDKMTATQHPSSITLTAPFEMNVVIGQ